MEEYYIAAVPRSWGVSGLVQAVSSQIQLGWKPVGDIILVPRTEPDFDDAELCQRMSRTLDDND